MLLSVIFLCCFSIEVQSQKAYFDSIYQISQDTLVFDYQAGKKYLKKAIYVSENDSIIQSLHLQVGTLLWAHSEYDSARYYLTKVLENSMENQQIASAANTMGLSYFYQAEYNIALEWFEKSMETYKMINDSSGISRVFNNLGLVHQAIGEFEKATEYIVEGLKYKVRYIGLADQYYSTSNPLKIHSNKDVSSSLILSLNQEIDTTRNVLNKAKYK
jgi:tetratricopeptide (TPR) repeat protein